MADAEKKTKEIGKIIALSKSKKPTDHNRVLELLKGAGNQIGVIEQVFETMSWNKPSKEFRDFIIPKVIENQFYRYKIVAEFLANSYDIYFPITNAKEFVVKLWDIVSGNYKKYWNTIDVKTVYMMLTILPDKTQAYNDYFFKCINSDNRDVKFIALHHVRNVRKDKVRQCTQHFDQKDLEFYDPLLGCLTDYNDTPTKSIVPMLETRGHYRTLYPKLCDLLNRLPKKNLHWNIDGNIWFPRDVKFNDIVEKIFFILKKLNDKKLIRDFEKELYPKLDIGKKLIFVSGFREHISLDYRREMLNYFGHYDWWESMYEKKYCKIFERKPLTYDEAIIISDFLKSKRVEIKNNIFSFYLRMSQKNQVMLKEYLNEQPEEYKRAVAIELAQGKTKKEKIKCAVVDKSAKITKPKIKKLSDNRENSLKKALRRFVLENKNYEYKSLYESDNVLLGNAYYPIDEEHNYPLQDKVDEIIKQLGLSTDEMARVLYKIKLGAWDGDKLSWSHYTNIVEGYFKRHNDALLSEALIKQILQVYWELPFKLRKKHAISGVRDFEKYIKFELLSEQALRDCFLLARVIQKSSVKIKLEKVDNYYEFNEKNVLFDIVILLWMWLEKGVAREQDIRGLIVSNTFSIARLLEESRYEKKKSPDITIFNNKCPKALYDIVEARMIEMQEMEVNRQIKETQYSVILSACASFFGIRFYAEMLKFFQKNTLPRGDNEYIWEKTKEAIFAKILGRVLPAKVDTYEAFVTLVKEYSLSESDLVKGVLYNSNQTLLEWTNKYLGKTGFVSCVMFFKAHLKDYGVSNAVQEKIALYSPIAIEDFKDGAVDVDWFWAMKNDVDDKTFKLVYDNAKYITVANFHKRAQRFNDALTGKLTAEECLAKIKETRNKEFVLYYSLVPLKDDKELQTRYEVVQKFLLESRQFGVQRQASEKKACEIALENMARVAGYEDVDRFVWFMESKDAGRLALCFEPKAIGEFEACLQITDRFKCKIVVSKNGKELSSVPAGLKANSHIVAIKAEVSTLNKQSARVIKSLENAMERESIFSLDELTTIAINPIIKQILKSLLFIVDKKTVLFDGESFVDLITKKVIKADRVFIAHPYDLLANKSWETTQCYLLQNKIRQPFKQAFRELYPKTDDEMDAMETNRYYGHQVNVNKAIAVGKNRGWHSGENIGLQKVFYKEGIIAVLFGVWDLGYSSFNDHPTLSQIYFVKRKAETDGSYKIIPIKDIGDKMFSEIMRDVDLIVSTAHPQGYDFEESLSTVEVRRQVCQSIIDLLNLSNVCIEKQHIHIKGSFGEYSVNLRSGIADKKLSGNLNIMAINDSTHNKLFLNFIDDNPKTAEIVSKMLLLADDKKIKDVNILRDIG
ncbi:MAG: DUF4132 domain-containing protein [Firmicutes bacterium]|nr:DUF4132 domain-containing protein [Bacillota bacterium]